MVESPQSSNDSSIDCRIASSFEIESEINSEPPNSPNSYNSYSSISSLGSNSPIERLPTDGYIPQNFIDVELSENDSLDGSNQSSNNIYSIFNEDNKPYLYKYVNLVIWLSYLVGVFITKKQKFNTVSPANSDLYFQIVSNYPNCKDTRVEIWRFFTSSIVHSDIAHITANTILLYPVMYIIELLNNKKSVIILILLVCFYTNLIFSYFHPYKKVVGCSHIVFGFTGSLLSEVIINGNYLGYNVNIIIFSK